MSAKIENHNSLIQNRQIFHRSSNGCEKGSNVTFENSLQDDSSYILSISEMHMCSPNVEISNFENQQFFQKFSKKGSDVTFENSYQDDGSYILSMSEMHMCSPNLKIKRFENL